MAESGPSGQTRGAATARVHAARLFDRPPVARAISRATPATADANAARRRDRWYRVARSSFIEGDDGGLRALLVQLHADQFRHAGLLHRHAVETIGDLHRLAVVRDEDELGMVLHRLEHLHESADVGVVERRVDLVEQAERART